MAIPDPTSTKAEQRGDRPGQAQGKAPFRINRILGRVVPSLLLAYISASYKLVVVDYGYSHLYRARGEPWKAAFFLGANHAIFLVGLRAYLHVFLAHPVTPPGRTSALRQLLGARLGVVGGEGGTQSPSSAPASRVETRRQRLRPGNADADATDDGDCLDDEALEGADATWRQEQDEVFECDERGEPLLCWRDECAGRIKPLRTRHCGDCRTCRPGLDHHCPWFDADIVVGSTTPSFLLLLGVVAPLLYATALGPLLPFAWSHARSIWSFARSSDEVRRRWWDRRWSWVGGPIWRWAVGWIVAAWILPPPPSPPPPLRSYAPDAPPVSLAHPCAGPPVLVGIGAALVAICTGLFVSTLRNLLRGETTIEVERRRAARRLVYSSSDSSHHTTTASRAPGSPSSASSRPSLLYSYYSVKTTKGATATDPTAAVGQTPDIAMPRRRNRTTESGDEVGPAARGDDAGPKAMTATTTTTTNLGPTRTSTTTEPLPLAGRRGRSVVRVDVVPRGEAGALAAPRPFDHGWRRNLLHALGLDGPPPRGHAPTTSTTTLGFAPGFLEHVRRLAEHKAS